MTKKMIFIILMLFSASINSRAQFYSVGSEPSFVKWRQLDGEHYRIIYPSVMDSLARDYLYIAESLRPMILEPLKISPAKMDIILHGYTTLSNGSVAVAPTRVDLFTLPNAYRAIPQNWSDQLVLHELRHTGQDDHFTKGAYHTLSYLFGEQIYGAGLGLFIPKLSLEGDAVMAETELSNAGRGRKADFFQHTRAMFLTDEIRSYKQMMFGSNFKKTPDIYTLGYLCYSAARFDTQDYFYPGNMFYAYSTGFQFFKDIFKKKDERPFKDWNELYKRSIDLYTDFWREDALSRGSITEYRNILQKREKMYCDYTGAIKAGDMIYTVKKGVQFAPELIGIDSLGKEHHISYFTGYGSNLSTPSGGRFYWSETIFHNTPSLLNYSVIRYYDFVSQQFGQFGYNTRYFNPEPNQDGSLIAFVEYPIEGSSYLLIADRNGSIKSRTEAPQKGQIMESAFIGNDIFCTITLESGIAIYRYSNGLWSLIQPAQHQSINSLHSANGLLYFSSDIDGLNNIFSFNPKTHSLTKLTNSEFGADYPYWDTQSETLYCSLFDKDGYHPVKIKSNDLSMSEAFFDKPAEYPFIDTFTSQKESQSMATRDVTSERYLDPAQTPSQKYSQIGHLIHIHSWAPVYYNIDNIMAADFDQLYSVAAPGATIYSQNNLGNIVTMLGYSYHGGHNAAHFKTTANILNSTLEISADYNDEYRLIYGQDSSIVSTTPQLSSKIRLYKSINFYKGGWNRRLTPQIELKYTNDLLDNKNICSLKYGLSYSQTLPVASSQIFPRFGFGGTVSYTHTMFNLGTSPLLYGYAFTYLPGFSHSQGLKLTATFQTNISKKGNIRLSSIASLPRGYKKSRPIGNFVKTTVDYAIPINLYDTDLKLLYLKRLQLIPFADYALDINRNAQNKTYSFGCDCLFDFNLLQFAPDFQAGVRYSRTPLINEKNHFEMLFSVSM